MSLFRYRAVALAGGGEGGRGAVTVGELSGESPAEVRARLRAGGLQVLDLAPIKKFELPKLGVAEAIASRVDAHLRVRRRSVKEEVFDGLATLIDSGVPLAEAVDTILTGEASRHTRLRRMILAVREEVRSGTMLAAALGQHRSWFDPVEVALLEAGEHGGSLAGTLRSLAARQSKRGAVLQKVAGALVYPSVVLTVAVGVWVFLSTKTLPQLVKILDDAKIETPAITRAVMAAGGFVAHFGAYLVVAAVALLAAASTIAARLAKTPSRVGGNRSKFSRVGLAALRRLRLARVTESLAELLHGGVPLVEGLRAVAPTAGSVVLRSALNESAGVIEQGERFSETLRDEAWFPAEFRRLVEMGETSGELAPLLEKLGQRMERSAERRITQLASLLEPAAILTLAALIGVVVAAAVLPITRLQDLV